MLSAPDSETLVDWPLRFQSGPGQPRDDQGQRIERFDAAIDRAVDAAPEELRATVDARQALRGVAKVTAVTLATEFGCFSRFEKAGQVMSYTGMVPSEHSSGPKTRRGAITKTGNSHLRRVLVESAWHYRHRPRLCKRQKDMQASLSPKVATSSADSFTSGTQKRNQSDK